MTRETQKPGSNEPITKSVKQSPGDTSKATEAHGAGCATTVGKARNDLLPKLQVVSRPVAELKANSRDIRKAAPRHIEEIAASIQRFGFSHPILIDKGGEVVDGHIRLAAAHKLDLSSVPCIRVDHLSEEEIRFLRLALNRLQEKGEWDFDVLKLEFEELLDLDLGLDGLGFEVPEIDFVLNFDSNGETPVDNKADALPSVDSGLPTVASQGDVWCLGQHRIICGDATKPETYEALMSDKVAQLVITDPPFNVPIDGHVGGAGSIKHAEFPMASGEMTDEEFAEFLKGFLDCVIQSAANKALLYTFMDWRHIEQLLQAARDKSLDLVNLCVWAKTNGGLGAFYRSRHELIPVFRKGSGGHINNVQLGRHGRNRTNVWEYAGANTLDPEKRAELKLHPTVKPVELIADAILDASAPKDIVLDPFLGSGTTCIAAEQTKRICYGIELDPRYVDVAVRRWQQFTGETATHHVSGQPFDQLADELGAKASTCASTKNNEESRS